MRLSQDEIERIFGKGSNGYQLAHADRLAGMRKPRNPADLSYMRGWFASLNGTVHNEQADYKTVLPVLDLLLKEFQRISKKNGWPKPDHLPL